MTAEVIALVVSIVGGISGITSIVAFVASRKQKQRDDGAKEARINASLETIKIAKRKSFARQSPNHDET